MNFPNRVTHCPRFTFSTRLVVGLLVAILSRAVDYAAETHASAAGSVADSVVKMRPFKVMAEWIEIRPMLSKGLIDHIRIAYVQPASPAADAGLLPGMQVVELHGIPAVGMGERDFFACLQALPPASHLTLKVRALTHNGSFAVVVPFAPPKPALPDNAPVLITDLKEVVSVDDAKARLAEARRMIDRWYQRRPSSGLTFDSFPSGTADWAVNWAAAREQLTTELQQLLPAHLALFCDTAMGAGKSVEAGIHQDLLVAAINRRSDYDPTQKAAVLRCLTRLPNLIFTVNRMGWAEGADAIMQDAWNAVKHAHRPDGVLDWLGATYARHAARAGALDALVAIASALQQVATTGGTNARDKILATDIEMLQTLVPQQPVDIIAGTEFILKNRRRLVFDAKQRKYVLKP